MASSYWIKLYHEILHDPKMERLSDHLYRRCMELFLLAGETDREGELPSVDDMAWTFRSDVETMQKDLVELARVGILHQENDRWIVTHFAERQDNITPAEGMARLRDRRHKAEYYVPAKETKPEPAPESAQAEATPQEQSAEPPAASQDINTPSEAPVNDQLRNLTQIRLDKIRLDTDEIRQDCALPAPSTAPTAPDIPLIRDKPDFAHERRSYKLPKLPTMPVENDGLSEPEIQKIQERTIGFCRELLHPKMPSPDDEHAICAWGKLWGYKHVLEVFSEAARGKNRRASLAEIYNSIGNGHVETISAIAAGG